VTVSLYASITGELFLMVQLRPRTRAASITRSCRLTPSPSIHLDGALTPNRVYLPSGNVKEPRGASLDGATEPSIVIVV